MRYKNVCHIGNYSITNQYIDHTLIHRYIDTSIQSCLFDIRAIDRREINDFIARFWTREETMSRMRITRVLSIPIKRVRRDQKRPQGHRNGDE